MRTWFAAVPERDALERWLLPDPAARAKEGTLLRGSRHRTTARVEVPGVGPVLLKVHHPRGFFDALRDLFRGTRGRREWEAARLLAGAGQPVPEALAAGETRRGFLPAGSFYAARYAEHAVPLDAWCAGAAPEERVRILRQAGATVRRLHDLGFDHRDLQATNLLVGAGDRVVLVDLHRVRSGKTVSESARWRGLAPLVQSLRSTSGDLGRDLGAVLDGYAPDLDERTRPAALRWFAHEEGRLNLLRLRRSDRHATKESGKFTRLERPLEGWRRRSVPQERVVRALDEHDAALAASDARVKKRSGRGAVTAHGDLVVKETRRTGFDRVREALIPGRRSAGYRNAHGLAVRGVLTALPLAFVRGNRGRSYAMYEDLSRLSRLDDFVRAALPGRPDVRPILLESTALWVAALHGCGIYHGDLKAVNVRLGEGEGPHLIDTDRVRFFPHPVGARRRVKNLAQLAASIPRVVTRSDRLRWFRIYAKDTPFAEQERQVARAVARQLARKIVVVDEPIE